MDYSTLIYIVLLWYTIGCFSFLYWFTKKHRIDMFVECFMMFVGGFFGLVTWFIGYKIHSNKNYNIFGVKVK